MRNLKKTFSVTLALMLALCCMFTIGFANEDTAVDGENTGKSSIEAYLKEHVTAVTGDSIATTDTWIRGNFVTKPPSDDAQAYSVDGQEVYLRKGVSESQAVQHINSMIDNEKTNSNMQTLTNGLNITADTVGATAIMSGFAPIISLVVGVLVTLVTVGMTVFSALDICYIAFPVFRNKCEDAKTNGGGGMVKTSANGETKLRFITDEAIQAVSEATTDGNKSAWAIYFKKRVMSYILLAIVLFILMTGNISLITGIALNIVSGIMNVLGGLA